MKTRLFTLFVLLVFIFTSAFSPLRNYSHAESDQSSYAQTISPRFGVSLFGVSPIVANETIQNLTTLTGAYYDLERNELVLLGINEPGLPKLRMDDFVIALKAIYSNDYPAVSIDPGENENAMVVSYWGNTETTHFGQVMFEADRLLKTLSMGRDNVTGQSVSSKVPGFQTYIKRSISNYSSSKQNNVWFRMWFEPEKTTVLTTKDKQSILLDSPAMIAQTEYLPPNYGNDPNANDFVAHINENFAAYESEYPVLHELKQLEQWLLIAKWMRDSDIPIDFSSLDLFVNEKFETPSETPTITVTETFVSGDYLISLGLFGGVDFRIPSENYEVSEEKVSNVINLAKSARGTSETVNWDVTLDGNIFNAVAISPIKTTRVGSFSTIENDLGSRSSFAEFGFSRYYDSFSSHLGEFGIGWRVIPFDMTYPNATDLFEEKLRQINVYDYTSQSIHSFLLSKAADGKLVYFDKITRTFLDVQSDGSYEWQRVDGTIIRFNDLGKVTFVSDAMGNSMNYSYSDNGLLATIQNGSEKTIEYKYDKNNRVVQAVGPNGEVVKYSYDAKKMLSGVTSASGYARKYTYDKYARLANITDELNQQKFKLSYDILGRLKTQTIGKDVTYLFDYDDKGNVLKITNENDPNNARELQFDKDGRLISLDQAEKPSLKLEYNDKWTLPSRAQIDEKSVTMEYDYRNNLVKFSLGEGLEFNFNRYKNGKIASIQTPERVINFERNQNGAILRIVDNVDLSDFSYTFERNSDGTLTSIKYPTGDTFDTSRLLEYSVSTNRNVLKMISVGNDLVLGIIAYPNGQIQEIEFTLDNLIRDAILENPEFILSDLSLAEKYEKIPEVITRQLGTYITTPTILIFEGDVKNVNFAKVFPNQTVIRIRNDDLDRVKRITLKLESTFFTPKSTVIINGIPAKKTEVAAIGLSEDYFDAWNGVKSKWQQSGTKYGYKTTSGTSTAFSNALQNSPNVVVIVAHADGNTIYWPDGTKTTTEDITNMSAEIQANNPLVVLYSCEGAKIGDMNNITESLLNAGASGVIAPTTSIEASGPTLDLFIQTLYRSSKGQSVLDALKGAEMNLGNFFMEIFAQILDLVG